MWAQERPAARFRKVSRSFASHLRCMKSVAATLTTIGVAATTMAVGAFSPQPACNTDWLLYTPMSIIAGALTNAAVRKRICPVARHFVSASAGLERKGGGWRRSAGGGWWGGGDESENVESGEEKERRADVMLKPVRENMEAGDNQHGA